MWHFFDIFIVILVVGVAGILLVRRFFGVFNKKQEDSHCMGCSNLECPYKDKKTKH